MQEDHTTKQMLEQFADLAGKKVHVQKRSLVGAQLEAFGAAVRQDDVHLLAVAVSIAAAVPIVLLCGQTMFICWLSPQALLQPQPHLQV